MLNHSSEKWEQPKVGSSRCFASCYLMKHFSTGSKIMERPSSFGFCEDFTHPVSFKEVLKYDIGSVNSLQTVYCSTKWITWSFLAISFKLFSSVFNIWKARKALCASLLPVNKSVPDSATNDTSETVTYPNYISLEWILSFLSPQNNISLSYPRAWFSRASNYGKCYCFSLLTLQQWADFSCSRT